MTFLKNNQEKGFLLIDAIVAMFILTIALITIVGMFTSSGKLSIANEDLTQANKFAQQCMEKVKQVQPSDWGKLVKTTDTAYIPIGSTIGTVILPTSYTSPDNRVFTCTYAAKMISTVNSVTTHMVEVQLTVTWTSKLQSGGNKTNSVVLMIYREREDLP